MDNIRKLTDRKLASLIDHSLLKPNTTEKDIKKLCKEAKRFEFAAVCVNPGYVSLAKQLLKNSKVKVCATVGFPFGANTSIIKAVECRDAISNGASEIDFVVNVGAVKSGNYRLVKEEINLLRLVAHGKILKLILETAYLTRDEKIKICKIAKEAEIDFVKTSTGFAGTGATVEDIRLMCKAAGNKMGVKAAGGIRTRKDALKMIAAGASRIGTSAGIQIVTK